MCYWPPFLERPPERQNPKEAPANDGAWLRALREQVQPNTFKKGREYAESRRVTLLERTATRIVGRVLGATGGKYDVELLPDGQNLKTHCSCTSFNKYGPHCKHIVATALVHLAKLRQENMPAPKPPPTVISDATEDRAAEDEMPAAEDEEEIVVPPPLAEGEFVSLPALAKLESWLGLSSLLDFEFLYRITPSSPLATGGRHWVFDVRRTDQQAKGPIHVKRQLTAGVRMSPQDERLFNELAKHESRYDARIVLSDEDVADLVELLRHRRVIYRGTALVFSLEACRPTVRLESRDDGSTARLELSFPDGTTEKLKDVIVLAGRRTWVVHGQNLHPMEPEMPPRLLRKWLLEPEMSFPANQVDRVLTFFGAHLPRYRMALKADGIEVDEETEPAILITVEGQAERVKLQLAARYGTVTVPISPVATHLGYAGSGTKLYRRREELERAAAKVLTDQGLKFDQADNTFEGVGDAAIYFWAKGQKELPKEWERFGVREERVKLRPKLKPKIKVGMSGVNWFELDAEFVTDDQKVDLGAVRMWLDSKKRFIALGDGSYAEADPAEMKRIADLLEEAGALPGKTRTRLPLYQAAALEMLTDLGEFSEVEEKAKTAIRSLKAQGGIPDIAAPDALEAELRHYQVAGLSWLYFLHRHGLSGILADDMGLGKTLQALSLLLKIRETDGKKPTLVVAPTSVLPNWEREAQKFAPTLQTAVWHGSDRKEKAASLKDVDLVLTSYALIRRDLEELSKVGFRYVILDEAQNIKNADSATAQACKSLPSDLRLALTGTPLENRLSELWSIFDFLMPGFLGSASTFSERYEHPIQVQGSPEAKDRLRRRIQPFILRRLKTEVAKDLPPRTETVSYCEMEPGQAALYREVLDESRRKVSEAIEKQGFNRSRVSILAALMRLRQVCCDPRLLKMPAGTLLPPSAKLERFMEMVDDLVAEGHRALVFSQFTQMLELLTQAADARGLKYMYLDGRTKDRMARVDAFNDPNGPPLFFISLKAGGTGLNLTAADYVIHFDPWWNPAVEDQATDRTHRIGQTKSVFSYKLITRNTVEEKILTLQRRKKELAAGVLGTGEDLGKMLTESDVDELFRQD